MDSPPPVTCDWPIENVTELLPKTPSQRKILTEAVVRLLLNASDKWQPYDESVLSEADENAYFLMVAAGLFEREVHLLAKCVGSNVAFRGVLRGTGEGGLCEALVHFNAECHQEWKEIVDPWLEAGQPTPCPLFFEQAGDGRIRLTSQGVEARETLKDPDDGIAIESVLGFVLKEWLFFRDFGIQRYGPSGRRPPVFGSGEMLRVEKVNLERPQQVVIHGAERVEIHDPQSKPLRVTKKGTRRPPSGRPAENGELVSFALALLAEGKTWKEIARKWNEVHPDKWRSENAVRMAVNRSSK